MQIGDAGAVSILCEQCNVTQAQAIGALCNGSGVTEKRVTCGGNYGWFDEKPWKACLARHRRAATLSMCQSRLGMALFPTKCRSCSGAPAQTR